MYILYYLEYSKNQGFSVLVSGAGDPGGVIERKKWQWKGRVERSGLLPN